MLLHERERRTTLRATERRDARERALATLRDVQRQVAVVEVSARVCAPPSGSELAAVFAGRALDLGAYVRVDANRRRLLLHRAALRAEVRRLSAELRALAP